MYILTRFIVIGIILILGFYSSISGKEENEKWLPNSFLGLKRFDSPTAYIYSQEGDDLVYAKNKIDNVASDFEIITGEKPKKGILIVIDPLKKHPWSHLYDLFHSIDPDMNIEAIQQQLNNKSKKININCSFEEALMSMPVLTPFDFFKLLVSFDQQNGKWSEVDVDNLLEKKDNNKDILEPWVLCLPSNECLLHASEKILPKVVRAKVGFSKYQFAKLDMGKLRAGFIYQFFHQSNTELFNCFLSTQELEKEEKDIFEKGFIRQLKIEEKETSNKL